MDPHIDGRAARPHIYATVGLGDGGARSAARLRHCHLVWRGAADYIVTADTAAAAITAAAAAAAAGAAATAAASKSRLRWLR